MRPVSVISAVAVLALILGGPMAALASEPDGKAGGVPDAPKGWSKKEDDKGNTVYRPDNLATGDDMNVTVMRGEASDGDFRKWFDDKVKHLQAGRTSVKTTDPHAREVQGVSALMQAIVCKNDDAPSGEKGAASHFLFFTYLAAHPSGRAEMIVLSVTSNDLLKKYGADYKDLVAAWATARVGEAPTK